MSSAVLAEFAELGSATVYEAGGRRGYVDADLVQVVPGSRVAGPARTVRCGQDDNLMVHAAMAAVQPGEVLVLSMPEPRPVALVGDLLATQAKAQGAAAILVDASVRDIEELAELGLPIWARWVRVRGATKDAVGPIGEPVVVGGATIRTGDVLVLDADGVAVVEAERVDGGARGIAPARRARSGQAREARRRCAVVRPRRPAGKSGGMSEPVHDVAHIAHAELLTPFPDASLQFFVELFGMQIEHREGQSVFLRGWGEYQPYGLKLTESELPGLGHTALRAWSPSALERRVAAIEASGLGVGWNSGDHGHGPAYEFRDPDGHRFELLFEQDRYLPPEELRPRLKNVPQRHVDRGAAVKRIDHVNVLASDVAANRRFAVEQLGYRTYEQVINDDGSEQGAWMSLSIAAHELIYTADHAGGNGRLHHLAWFVDTREELLRAADLFLDADVPIEAAPSKHAVAQGMFLYVYEPGGNRVEVTTGTHFIFDPAYEPIVWTQAERARGQAWGVKTIETFHTYGTPDLSGRPPGPPIPPTSQIPMLSHSVHA